MPDITFSNGVKMKNWDCKEALNIDKMNNAITEHLSKEGVIFSGFACRDEWFTMKIDFHIHLQIDIDTCYLRRQEQGKDSVKMGHIIVKELVYPFYMETLKKSRIDFTIDANKKTEKTLDKIITCLIQSADTILLKLISLVQRVYWNQIYSIEEKDSVIIIN